MKKLSLIILAAVAVSGSAFAGTETKTFKDKVVVEPTSRFRDTELQVDTFFLGVLERKRDNGLRDGLGGGVGVNFFFARYFGIGAEQEVYGNDGKAAWATLGNFFVRYPINSINLAPYAVVGGGGFYGSNIVGSGIGTVGGGAEYRFINNLGLFADARWFYGHAEGALFRTGLRFAF